MARTAIKIYLKSAIESGFDFIERRFGSVEEMNENFRMQRKWIFEKIERKADFKRRLAKVLEVIKMHSCKYLGISFMTENSMRDAYEAQFGESISKRSIGTYVKQLKEIGFVTTVPAKREDGKQTASIVVIEKLGTAGERRSGKRPAPEEEEKKGGKRIKESKGDVSSENVAHKEGENLRTEKTTPSFKALLKEHKERMAKERRLLNFVPKWFKDQIACCATEGRKVYEYWKVSKHLMNRTFGTAIEAEDKQAVVRAAIREFFLSAKAAARGKFRMDNPFGFFHSVLEAEGYAHIRRKVQASSGVLFNWLVD